MGHHTHALTKLVETGRLHRVARGIYRGTNAPRLGSPDLIIAALLAPETVIGLVSALSHYGLTDEIPRTVDLLVLRDKATPRINYPPIRTFRTSAEVVAFAVASFELDGTTIHMTTPAKTVADCFKFRKRVGLNVAIDALRQGLDARAFKPAELMAAAEVDRVANTIRPYLQGMLS